MKSYISGLKPKTIFAVITKTLIKKNLLRMSKQEIFLFQIMIQTKNYSVLSDTFLKLLDRHAPLKKKKQRGNHAPFISKEMRKAIYTRSRLRNNFCKNPSEENERKYERQRNLCESLRRKAINNFLILPAKEW